MTGFLLLGVLGVWLVLVVWLARWLTKSIKRDWLRYIALVIVITCLFPLIVIDELISKPQFERLCAEGAKLKFDPQKIRGKTIFLGEIASPKPSFTVGFLGGYYIPWRYLDATTKEELIAYNSYHIEGGFLIRALGISETRAPLMMESFCSPNEKPTQKSFLERFELKRVERKDVK